MLRGQQLTSVRGAGCSKTTLQVTHRGRRCGRSRALCWGRMHVRQPLQGSPTCCSSSPTYETRLSALRSLVLTSTDGANSCCCCCCCGGGGSHSDTHACAAVLPCRSCGTTTVACTIIRTIRPAQTFRSSLHTLTRWRRRAFGSRTRSLARPCVRRAERAWQAVGSTTRTLCR